MPSIVAQFISKILFKNPGQCFSLVLHKPFHRELTRLFNMPDNQGNNKVDESYFNMIAQLGYQDLSESLIDYMNCIFYTNSKMPELLKELKDNGCTLHLFSNIGAKGLQNIIEKNRFAEIFTYFEKNIINYEVTQTYQEFKPKGQAYELALINAGCKADQAIMIDNTLDRLPTKTGIARAQRKALKKGISYVAPQPWAASILYNHNNHKATLNYFMQLGLIG
jgi:FMN phosphatase YigB (HAD superfamily)